MNQRDAKVGQKVTWTGNGDRVWTITAKPKNGTTVTVNNMFRVSTSKLELVSED